MDDNELDKLKKKIGEMYNEAVSDMREPDLEFDDWDVAYFTEAYPLINYLKSLKGLIGQKIYYILTLGCIFNIEDIIQEKDKQDKNRYLSLDEPVVVIIGEIQFEVWFYTDSRVKIGISTLKLEEKSYTPFNWTNCNKIFSDVVIGQKIVGFEVEKSNKGFYDSVGLGDRPDGGDYFVSFKLILENGKYLEFSGNCEYMGVGCPL
jgi:hypothetical protein